MKENRILNYHLWSYFWQVGAMFTAIIVMVGGATFVLVPAFVPPNWSVLSALGMMLAWAWIFHTATVILHLRGK